MAKKATPPPSTMLVISLHPDGNATLIVQRAEWAVMHRFTYAGLGDIFTAVQQSAGHLVEVEQNPPGEDPVPAAPVVSTEDVTPFSPSPENEEVETDSSDAPDSTPDQLSLL